jgi:hypothetical protein
MAIATVNPATGETLKTFQPLTSRSWRTAWPVPQRRSRRTG